jgi:hypothetical protein
MIRKSSSVGGSDRNVPKEIQSLIGLSKANIIYPHNSMTGTNSSLIHPSLNNITKMTESCAENETSSFFLASFRDRCPDTHKPFTSHSPISKLSYKNPIPSLFNKKTWWK